MRWGEETDCYFLESKDKGLTVWSTKTRSTYRIVGAGRHWMEEKHDTLLQALRFTIHMNETVIERCLAFAGIFVPFC